MLYLARIVQTNLPDKVRNRKLLFGRKSVAQGSPRVYAYTLWLDVSACRKVGVYVDKKAHSTTNVEKNNKFYGKIKIIT